MKQYFIRLALFLFFSQIVNANAQDFSKENQEEQTLTLVNQMPQYKGGDAELQRFISQNIKYPEKALNNNVSGTVWIQFIVNKTGKLSDFKILKAASEELGEESIRVLQLMPEWIPGKHDGREVNVFVKLPIKFTLTDDKKEKKKQN